MIGAEPYGKNSIVHASAHGCASEYVEVGPFNTRSESRHNYAPPGQ